MDMRRAARIPAGINGGEAHSTVSISELSAAQESLALSRAGRLARIAGIDPKPVGVPPSRTRSSLPRLLAA